MSSIYRKGRDGYFYYQTYKYNPDTKKKDKKIFHSLSTKDLSQAKKKQKEFDTKYDKKRLFLFQDIFIYILLHYKIICLSALGGGLLSFFFFSGSLSKNKEFMLDKKKLSINIIDNNIALSNTIPIKDFIFKKANSLDKGNNIKIIPEPILKKEQNKIILPKYNIERFEKLTSPIKIGKLYVTIDKNIKKEDQKELCRMLTSDYSEFSNMIICLYTNDKIGKNMAYDPNINISFEDKKKSWLALYTYNKVEGEYFDDHPTSYLNK